MQRQAEFLDYRPSQNAAAAILLSVNICKSNLAPAACVEKIPEYKISSLIYVTLMIHKDNEANTEEIDDSTCPLRIWNKSIEKLTYLKKDSDVKPAYC